MKHMTSPKPKEARATCVECRTILPATLMRVVSADPLKAKCTNEAACRKRKRRNETIGKPARSKP